MLFQTPEFLILFIVSIAGVVVLRRNAQQHWLMAVLSYGFYAWLDVRLLILLFVTSLVDYVAALGMDSVCLPWRRRWELSGLLVAAALLTLGFDWPLLQGGGDLEDFSWTAFLQPSGSGALIGIGVCAAFAAIWPLIYEGMFLTFTGDRRRRAFLVASVVSNLTVLGFFKYFDFFVDSVIAAGSQFGLDLSRPHLEVLLPMGISFYTFVSMSYTIDAYRRQVKPEQSFLRFALFVSYFPHLVAGPIIRPENFLPTLHERWVLRSRNIISGAHLILNGLVKKLLIADAVGPFVSVVFDNPSTGATSLAVMTGAAMFAIQIYCDFSGYSDIARGVSRMFGPELPLNFDYPYFSTSIIDFWRTWHMSLSSWLRDYLYIPLGGGRASPPRVYANLMITMILGGLWHGASWNFVIWGSYQGALLCLNRLVRWVCERVHALDDFLRSRVGTVLRWLVTMYLVLLGWLIFLIRDPDQLMYCARKFMFFDGNLGLASLGLGRGAPFMAAISAAAFCALHTYSRFRGHWHDRLDRASPATLPLVYAALGVAFFYLFPAAEAAFIYFQF